MASARGRIVPFVPDRIGDGEVGYGSIECGPVPRYEAMAMRSPERACARTSAQPQMRPQTARVAGVRLVVSEETPSQSWRT